MRMRLSAKVGSVVCAATLACSLCGPAAWADPQEAASGVSGDTPEAASTDAFETVEATGTSPADALAAESPDTTSFAAGASAADNAEPAALLAASDPFDPSAISAATVEDTRDVWVHVTQASVSSQGEVPVTVSALLSDGEPASWDNAVEVTRKKPLAGADSATPLGRDVHLAVDAVPMKLNDEGVLEVGEVQLNVGNLNLPGNSIIASFGDVAKKSVSLMGSADVQAAALEGFESAGIMLGCRLTLGAGSADAHSQVGQLAMLNFDGALAMLKQFIAAGGSGGEAIVPDELARAGAASDATPNATPLAGGIEDMLGPLKGFAGSLTNNASLSVVKLMALGAPLVNNGTFSLSEGYQVMMGAKLANNGTFETAPASMGQMQLCAIENSGAMTLGASQVQLSYVKTTNNASGTLRLVSTGAYYIGNTPTGNIPDGAPDFVMSTVTNRGSLVFAGPVAILKDAPVVSEAGGTVTMDGSPVAVFSESFQNDGKLCNKGELELYGPLTNAGLFSNEGLITLKQNVVEETGALDSTGAVVDKGGTYLNVDGKGRVTSEVAVSDADRAILSQLGTLSAPPVENPSDQTKKPAGDEAKPLARTGDGMLLWAGMLGGAATLALAVAAVAAAARRRKSSSRS